MKVDLNTLVRRANLLGASLGKADLSEADLSESNLYGADFMDATPDAVKTANRAHARHGTTTIFPTEATETDAELIHAIQQAHQRGLKVMLKPHVDIVNTTATNWRGLIGRVTSRSARLSATGNCPLRNPRLWNAVA